MSEARYPFTYQDIDHLLQAEVKTWFEADDTEGEVLWKRARQFVADQHAALVLAEKALTDLMPPYCREEGPCPRCAWDSVAHEALAAVRKALQP